MEKTVTAILKTYRLEFHPVVSFQPGKDQLLLMDLTKNNKDISEELVNDTQRFTNYVNQKLRSANAKLASEATMNIVNYTTEAGSLIQNPLRPSQEDCIWELIFGEDPTPL